MQSVMSRLRIHGKVGESAPISSPAEAINVISISRYGLWLLLNNQLVEFISKKFIIFGLNNGISFDL
jgi:hypothetical protein